MGDIFDMAAAERRMLADTLDGFTDDQWYLDSLCDGWKVRDVVAHLVWPTETSIAVIILKMAAKGFNFDRLALETACGDRRSPLELNAALRKNADSQFKPPGMGPEAPLTDVIVHGYDIRRPLGIAYDVDDEPALIALEFLVSKKGQNAVGHRKGLIDGLHFEAADKGWSHGDGPIVKGDTTSLMLVLAGRRSAIEDLTGDGVDELTKRLAGR